MQNSKEFFPINLMLNHKPCLVVGGGAIAERKTQKLIVSGANITVICPEPSPFIQEQARLQTINFLQREFNSSDVKGFFLVFAATNNKKVNKSIIKECNKKSILCCAVDKNWKDGSFITPASFSKPPFTISVSSNGIKCKDSKRIKTILKSAMDTINDRKEFTS